MKATTRFAAALLTSGLAIGTYSATSASAAEVPVSIANASSTQTASTTAAARDVGTMASCQSESEAYWLVPDGAGSWAGYLYWEDYNNYDSGSDQDNFYLNDRNFDAQSSSYSVTNNYTRKTYYKHLYSGDAYCMGVGNIPNGETASWKICGWNEGDRLACKEGTIEE